MEIRQNLTSVNRTRKLSRNIKYIVIHYTANKGDTAWNNTKYFKTEKRSSSAHYFVDKNGVCQSVKDVDIAWHCGATEYLHPLCRNSNSIGIELCNGVPDFEEATVKNAAMLTKMLMEKYGIPTKNVLRHYDVTGKLCPKPFVDESRWQSFKKILEGDDIDMEELEKFKAEYAAYVEHTSNIINTMGQEIQSLQRIINLMGQELAELRENRKEGKI